MSNPEIGKTIAAHGLKTNYHDEGAGFPAVFVHGSGPGVTGWANWRLNIPEISKSLRVIAPDMAGFGYTQRPEKPSYTMPFWCDHLIALADELKLEKFDLIGNSFGGGLAVAMAAAHPDRIRRLVLMGAVGVPFELTEGLDKVWGYQPSIENMRELLDIFAYNRDLVTDDLAKMRYEASIRDGVQEAFSAMFPAPRQQWIQAMTTPDEKIAQISAPTLIVHGREDKVIPVQNSLKFFDLIPNAELHLFGKCGHWTQIEHAARFNMLVTDFLTSP